jgi:hypothetical protein
MRSSMARFACPLAGGLHSHDMPIGGDWSAAQVGQAMVRAGRTGVGVQPVSRRERTPPSLSAAGCPGGTDSLSRKTKRPLAPQDGWRGDAINSSAYRETQRTQLAGSDPSVFMPWGGWKKGNETPRRTYHPDCIWLEVCSGRRWRRSAEASASPCFGAGACAGRGARQGPHGLRVRVVVTRTDPPSTTKVRKPKSSLVCALSSTNVPPVSHLLTGLHAYGPLCMHVQLFPYCID